MYAVHSQVWDMAAKTASVTAVCDKGELIPLDPRNLFEKSVELLIADIGYVTPFGVDGVTIERVPSFDGTDICIAFRFEKMVRAVIAGAAPSKVYKHIVPRFYFLVVNETIEQFYDIGVGRCQRFARDWVFGTEETLYTFFWHAKVVD